MMNENQRLTLARETLKKLARYSENLPLVLDVLEEAQTVKTEELFKALDDERRRVGLEVRAAIGRVAYQSHPAVDPTLRELDKAVRRICRLEDGDE